MDDLKEFLKAREYTCYSFAKNADDNSLKGVSAYLNLVLKGGVRVTSIDFDGSFLGISFNNGLFWRVSASGSEFSEV